MSLLGEHAVGLQLAVWWPAEGQWQYAKVRCMPQYSDGYSYSDGDALGRSLTGRSQTTGLARRAKGYGIGFRALQTTELAA